MRQAGEPSVEEILESIKKVIARDNRAGATDQGKGAEDRAIRPDTAAHRAAEDDEVFDLADAELVETDDVDNRELAADSPLLTEDATSSMRDSLTALAMLAEPPAAPQIVRSGETSLEGLTRELMRPMLADWLDKNLPPLVERMVAAEIARIVGKKI